MMREVVRSIIGKNNIELLYSLLISYKIKKFGKLAIESFDKIASDNKKNYWLAFGTLLGAYREKGFIKNDDDIDVAMFTEDISSSFIDNMKRKGFIFDHCLMTDDSRFFQFSFKFHGIPFDIYCFNRGLDEKMITGFIPRAIHGKNWAESYELNKFKVLQVTMPFGGIKRTHFLDFEVSIPNCTEEFLRLHYGEDFMTPVKGKKGNSKKTIKEISIEDLTASIVDLEYALNIIKNGRNIT